MVSGDNSGIFGREVQFQYMRILFIVNPISGLGSGKELPERIKAIPEYEKVVLRQEIRVNIRMLLLLAAMVR